MSDAKNPDGQWHGRIGHMGMIQESGGGGYNKHEQQLSLCYGESVRQSFGPTTVLCTFAAKSRTR